MYEVTTAREAGEGYLGRSRDLQQMIHRESKVEEGQDHGREGRWYKDEVRSFKGALMDKDMFSP